MSDHADENNSEASDSSQESSIHSLLTRQVETRAQASARQNTFGSGNATASLNNSRVPGSNIATPLTSQVGIPVITNTTSNASSTSDSFGTPRSIETLGNQPSVPAMDQITHLFERLLRGQFSETTPIAPKVSEITSTTSVKQVPHSEYTQTTTAQSKSFSDLKFGNNVSTNRETLKCVKVLLAETGLLPLVDGSRRKPIYTEENKFGYTPDTVVKNGFEITLVPKDDLFKYSHDCKRLFSIMYLITHKDLLYLVNQALLDKDGVAWYKAILEHVHGTTNTDIRKAKHALESLKVYDSKTVKENIAQLEEAFLNLNNAQTVPLTEEEMTYYIQEKFCLDGRISVQSVMATSKAGKFPYSQIILALIELDPPIVTRHKMSAFVGEKEICRNHLAGRCTLGNLCTRSHEPPKGKGPPAAPPGTKAPYQKGGKFKKSDEKHPSRKMPYPLTVTREHRASVGPPRGRQTEKNPLGWSNAQMNVLQHAQETAPQDAWSAGNAAYFTPQDGTQHRAHFNMLRTSSSSSSATSSQPDDPTEPPEEPEPHITSNQYAARHRAQRPPALRRFLRIQDHPNRTIEDIQIFKHIRDYYSQNPEWATPRLPTPCQNLLVYVHLHSNSDHYPGQAPLQPIFSDEGALFCALGWYVTTNETLRQFSKARNDVKLGTGKLYQLMFILGGHYYHADKIMPNDESPYFSTFDPSNMKYIHPGNPGSYASNMDGVPAYVIAFRNLEEAFVDAYIRDLLLLTMYYDFMAFLAVAYAKSMAVGFTLLQARTTIVSQLNNLLELTDLAGYNNIIKIMLVIAKQMRPAPPAPRIRNPGPPPRTPHLSCAVMSAPPDGYMPPSSEETSSSEEDGGDNVSISTEHSVPDYDEAAYSTHSTPAERSDRPEFYDRNYVPRRLLHPAMRPASAPSPMRAAAQDRPATGATMSSAVVIRSPTSLRKRLRSPQQNIRKRKQSSPQRMITRDCEETLMSPVRASKSSRTSTTPPEVPQKSPKDDDAEINLFQVNEKHTMNLIQDESDLCIIDSGASTSGTGNRSQLRNIRPTTITVSSAFGDSVKPTEMGDMLPHMIPTVLIDSMKKTTLYSVSQLCGQQEPLVGIFTAVDTRFYPFKQMLPYLKLISENCDEVLRGRVENGLYIMESK